MSQEYPTFSINERCFELIQNIVEDRKIKNQVKKHPLVVYNIAEIRLLIDIVREAYPLYGDADVGDLIDFVQDIFGVKVSESNSSQISRAKGFSNASALMVSMLAEYWDKISPTPTLTMESPAGAFPVKEYPNTGTTASSAEMITQPCGSN